MPDMWRNGKQRMDCKVAGRQIQRDKDWKSTLNEDLLNYIEICEKLKYNFDVGSVQ